MVDVPWQKGRKIDQVRVCLIAVLRTYTVHVAFCYRPSSLVCLSICLPVCLSMGQKKTAKQIDTSLGLWTRVGPRKHELDGVHIGATWRIQLNRLCAEAIRLFVKLLNHFLKFSYETEAT